MCRKTKTKTKTKHNRGYEFQKRLVKLLQRDDKHKTRASLDDASGEGQQHGNELRRFIEEIEAKRR